MAGSGSQLMGSVLGAGLHLDACVQIADYPLQFILHGTLCAQMM
jgi:hypothetical protein